MSARHASRGRASDEIPGTPENLAALARVLDGWRCCGAPNLCGAPCQDDEVSATLAQAAQAVDAARGVQS